MHCAYMLQERKKIEGALLVSTHVDPLLPVGSE